MAEAETPEGTTEPPKNMLIATNIEVNITPSINGLATNNLCRKLDITA